jgi:hypothetical protein
VDCARLVHYSLDLGQPGAVSGRVDPPHPRMHRGGPHADAAPAPERPSSIAWHEQSWLRVNPSQNWPRFDGNTSLYLRSSVSPISSRFM